MGQKMKDSWLLLQRITDHSTQMTVTAPPPRAPERLTVLRLRRGLGKPRGLPVPANWYETDSLETCGREVFPDGS